MCKCNKDEKIERLEKQLADVKCYIRGLESAALDLATSQECSDIKEEAFDWVMDNVPKARI